MMFAVVFLAQSLEQAPFDLSRDHYSIESKREFESYLVCFAKKTFELRTLPGSPTAHVRTAKAACRKEYDTVVELVAEDLKGTPQELSARSIARSALDRLDERAAIGPPAPAKLAALPVDQYAGDWRLGGGVLSIDLRIDFTNGDAVSGRFTQKTPAFDVCGIRHWKITADGEAAVFEAHFVTGRTVQYKRIPSFPGEMDFLNPEEISLPRIDLQMEDGDLLFQCVKQSSGVQLRFKRKSGTD